MQTVEEKKCVKAASAPPHWSHLSSLLLSFLLTLRFIPVVLLVLPASFWLRQYSRFVESRRHRATASIIDDHVMRVAAVQRQLRLQKKQGLCTSRPARDQMTMRLIDYKSSAVGIDLSKLDNVLEINAAGTTVSVEPGCSVLRLTSFLTPLGFALLVTPELDELTVGGLVAGYGIESSSHLHGLFFDTVEGLDVVVASGELVHW